MSQEPKERVWVKSSYSGEADQCVEIAWQAGGVAVRDSKNPGGAVLSYTRHEWQAFVQAIKQGKALNT
ncbi:DUF397 domain-containing protein [Bailinhaonella thermotolerans]|uniref:DUF397 domain-containing protein n=1 Tax=Bailinhaonella thermotolerans TaxID=1070861 RepID=A0A3A4B1I1_9ACTN|nr:DUF397 domain-containing protein [Bailinhaonella thermotolerans]RJL31270.1 DUF397 domain-containing protein [Bailinhaonella thermotolerans]